MINQAEIDLLRDALATLSAGCGDLPVFTPEFDIEAANEVLQQAALRMQDNYPYYHPQYAGQMLKPPHAIARVAYAMSLWVNPNNHALDGGRASSALEKECILDLGRLFHWDAPLGHLTGGGTMANLEALWVSGGLRPGKRIVTSEQAHYTHSRISGVLGLACTTVPVDTRGRMQMDALEAVLREGDVGTIVATIGTTGLGAVDPLPDILDLAARYGVRVHADAAYGGYFQLAASLQGDARAAFDALPGVDSIVVDPHKHGLQPYGCGCVLFRDPDVGRLYKHGSPYTYFTGVELHLGEISLECSRPGAAAVALWATQQLLPLERGGQFSTWLDDCLFAARDLTARLARSDDFYPFPLPEMDIVVYAARAPTASASSRRAREIFAAAAAHNLHLALADFPAALVQDFAPGLAIDADTVTCLRSVLMKPEHRQWVQRIAAILEDCAVRA